MNLAEPFVRRPVATTLFAIGLLLTGLVSYRALPVASMPTVDFPTIRVSASRPGANAETMAVSVAAPLERRLAAIPGVTEITSSSSLGSTTITIQFDVIAPDRQGGTGRAVRHRRGRDGLAVGPAHATDPQKSQLGLVPDNDSVR